MLTFLKTLRELARSHREVVAAYLFGSYAAGKAGSLSDVDVAVLLDSNRVKAKERFSFQLEMASEAMGACGRSDVDLVILNEASPLLAYEVVRSGQLLYERHHGARVAFEARVIERYLDLKPFYRVSRHYLKQQLLGKSHRG